MSERNSGLGLRRGAAIACVWAIGNAGAPALLHALFTGVRGRGILRSWPLLEPELLRPEGLPEAFPGRLDELGRAYDPFDLGLGAVSPYVVFCEYLPKGHLLLHAGDDVIGDLLLTRGERGASRASEEPLPEGSLFAHEDR